MTKVILEKYAAATDSYALVQQENNTAYLYFYIRPKTADEQIRAVWLKNYLPAKSGIDKQAEKQGLQPMMPLKATRHPEGSPKLKPEDLELVFLDDMDGVALYEKDELIAVIPGWAGQDGFSGYSRDAIGNSIFAHELGDSFTNEIFKKVEQAKELWLALDKDKLWETYRDERVNMFQERFSEQYEYFAIGESSIFPPKGIIKAEKDDVVYLNTVGLALLAQPTVEQYTEEPRLYRRMELGFAVQKHIFDKNESEIFSYLMGISTIPWAYTTFLAEGHTLLFDAKIEVQNKFSNIMLISDAQIFDTKTTKFREDIVSLLWMIPINSNEQKTAEEQGFKKLIAKDSSKILTFDGQYKFS